jgi:hypothetical protein
MSLLLPISEGYCAASNSQNPQGLLLLPKVKVAAAFNREGYCAASMGEGLLLLRTKVVWVAFRRTPTEHETLPARKSG